MYLRVLFACLLTVTLPVVPVPAEAAGTPAAAVGSVPLRVPPGFQAEAIYRVPDEQGSWVCLTPDPKGRLIVADQFGPLYRVRLPEREVGPVEVERLPLPIGNVQGLAWAFDSLYAVVNRSKADGGSGLYRLRDNDGDDQFEEVKLLRAIEGEGEHGPHALAPGPDGRSLYLLAGNATFLPAPDESRVPRNWQMDSLIPHLGQTDGVWRTNRPGGWVVKLDPDGRVFDLFAVGLRNPYDLAFNAEGELFTFDADMEWDTGTSWYRPTRVNHVTSGAEFGWRTGSAKWPDYYPDSQPAVLDIGESSPTGLTFGYGAKFPARYQRALFMGDWSYGKIFALHLTPQGGSYTATNEVFLAGSPLPITDLVIHPRDGALYFLTGGRSTASTLYRVSYVGSESAAPANLSDPTGRRARRQRQMLERFHGKTDPAAVEAVWRFLGSHDRALRYASRIALEHQPPGEWRDRALAATNLRVRLAATIALARSGSPADAEPLIRSLGGLDWARLTSEEQLELVRAYSLVGARLGRPESAAREMILRHLDARFPAEAYELNKELAQLLVFLDAPGIVDRLLTGMESAASQEEQLHHALCLRLQDPNDWTPRQRERYFGWFARGIAAGGGVTYSEYLLGIRSEMVDRLTPENHAAVAALVAQRAPVDPYVDLRQRNFVREWKVEDLLSVAASGMRGRDFEQGRRVFSTAMCLKCHRFNRQGGMGGPDLTGVGSRFDDRALLEAMLEPSKVVSDQYATVEVNTKDGESYTGRIGDQNEQQILLKGDLLNPANVIKVLWTNIEDVRPSTMSLMPPNLLDSFTEAEILDLLAYLKSQGDPKHAVFR